MISEAAVMLKPSWRGTPLLCPPKPITVLRRARSFMSRQRFHTTRVGSMSKGLPCCKLLSKMAAIRLLAQVMACRSPVKCRLMSSMGITCAQPPPVAPPLMPNTGPREGSLSARHTFLPSFAMPSARPMEVVVLPSPKEVGLMAVTSTRLSVLGAGLTLILALNLP